MSDEKKMRVRGELTNFDEVQLDSNQINTLLDRVQQLKF